MPPDAETTRQLNELRSAVSGLQRINDTQTKRIEALEAALASNGTTPQLLAQISDQFAELCELAKPLARHAGNIVAVQAGALGVDR